MNLHWTDLLTPFVLIRKRWVFWILLPVSLGGLFLFGYKDAGSYRGYSAGSILSPDRWGETAWTTGTGQAAVVNARLEALRSVNQGPVNFFAIMLLVTIALAVIVTMAALRAFAITHDSLEGEDSKDYWLAAYTKERGPLATNWLDEVFPLTLNNFVFERVVARPTSAFLDAPDDIRDTVLAPMRSFLSTGWGAVYKLTL